MTRILALSSQVAYGHVGLSAAVPVLQALGHQVTALPTVILSNHPGWPNVAGARVPVPQLQSMIDALDANGWLAAHDAVLTGYLPSAEHVRLAADLIDRLRGTKPDIRVVVDPVLGDMPKGLYIAEDAAEAIQNELVDRAGILTPNCFELQWLTGLPTGEIDQIIRAATSLPCRALVTSFPAGPGKTGILHCTDEAIAVFPARFYDAVPHGVGDVFSALIACVLQPGQALGHLQSLIEQSLGDDHLRIVETAEDWRQALPVTSEPL